MIFIGRQFQAFLNFLILPYKEPLVARVDVANFKTSLWILNCFKYRPRNVVQNSSFNQICDLELICIKFATVNILIKTFIMKLSVHTFQLLILIYRWGSGHCLISLDPCKSAIQNSFVLNFQYSNKDLHLWRFPNFRQSQGQKIKDLL